MTIKTIHRIIKSPKLNDICEMEISQILEIKEHKRETTNFLIFHPLLNQMWAFKNTDLS